ncbi:metal/formaldehyde-sensitive transcriptional repressor [Variovorax sp. VNK109]|jgi:DNA-binding FrmR family transcriptional regulator|uniref:metal/formaldehyde-sensitive transcriptional repressor n=1 Tax=Variovorax sp. VNK109 TaxID=3400919 RepID=UPI003BFD90E5
MPHSLEEKQRVIKRLRRIKGQTEALERAVEQGTDCGALLQQLAALRGASTGLMAEVLESHLRETFGPQASPGKATAKATRRPVDTQAEIDQLMRIVRSYLK